MGVTAAYHLVKHYNLQPSFAEEGILNLPAVNRRHGQPSLGFLSLTSSGHISDEIQTDLVLMLMRRISARLPVEQPGKQMGWMKRARDSSAAAHG